MKLMLYFKFIERQIRMMNVVTEIFLVTQCNVVSCYQMNQHVCASADCISSAADTLISSKTSRCVTQLILLIYYLMYFFSLQVSQIGVLSF